MRRTRAFAATLVVLMAFGLTACDAFEIFGDDKEIKGTVEDIGTDFILVDGVRYAVNGKTEFEGIDGLSDISIGDEVEIEYKESGGTRTALEIEVGDEEDDDGGLFG
jgi:predicted small secreted protein